MPLSSEQINFRTTKIKETLEKYKKVNVFFKDITSLAKALSETLSQEEVKSYENKEGVFKNTPRGCSYQTLLVNSQYKSLMESFLDKQEIVKDVGEIKFKSILATKDLEISNLKNNVKRLEKTILILAKEENKENTPLLEDKENLSEKFLLNFIENFSDYIEISLTDKKIYNLMEVPKKEIVDLNLVPGILEKIKNKT